jgi:hypothetical protein
VGTTPRNESYGPIVNYVTVRITPAQAPGALPRYVTIGATADLVLFYVAWLATLNDPGSSHAMQTMIAGRTICAHSPESG